MTIVPVISTRVTVDNTKLQQLPLKLSWGITIYKAHRLLIPKAIMYIGPKEQVGLC